MVKAVVAGAGRRKLFDDGRYFIAKFPGCSLYPFCIDRLSLVIGHGDFPSFTGQEHTWSPAFQYGDMLRNLSIMEAAFL